MKKIFSLLAALLCVCGMWAEPYNWNGLGVTSADDATEVGGKANGIYLKSGAQEYNTNNNMKAGASQKGNWTIQINKGFKSTASERYFMQIALDDAIEAGDTLKVAAFRTKASDCVMGIDFSADSASASTDVQVTFPNNLQVLSATGTPVDTAFVVPDGAVGAKYIRIYRSSGSTGLYVAHFELVHKAQVAPSGIYVVGTVNNWTLKDANYEMTTINDTAWSYSFGATELVGQTFKINDGSWSGSINLGSSEGLLKGTIALASNGDNIGVDSKYSNATNVVITLRKLADGSYKLTATGDFTEGQAAIPDLYLRGINGGWDATDAIKFAKDANKDEWTLTLDVTASNQFKVADANWGNYNFGGDGSNAVVPGTAYPLVKGSQSNLWIENTPTSGNYTFTVAKDGDNWTLKAVENVAPALDSIISFTDVKSAGALNGQTLKGENYTIDVTDTQSKISVDASNILFGTCVQDTVHFAYRMKTGGKSSSASLLTLTAAKKGILTIYARTGSNSATDRNFVVTNAQGTEVINHTCVEEYDTLPNRIDGNLVYLPVSAEIAAGTYTITYPTSSINFYGFKFVETTTPPVITYDTVMYVAGNFTEWATKMQKMPYSITLPKDSALQFKQIRVVKTYADGVQTDSTATWLGANDYSNAMTRSNNAWVLKGGENVNLKTDAKGEYNFALVNDTVFTVTFPELPVSYDYTKVTAAPADWSGEYVIAAAAGEDRALAWSGVDVKNKCYDTVEVRNNVISGDDLVTITVEPMAAGGYSIKVNGGANDGKYISSKAPNYSNGIVFGTDPVSINIAYNADGTDSLYQQIDKVLTDNKDSILMFMYNNGTDKYCRFYKTTSSYPVPSLYKKSGVSAPRYYIKNNWKGAAAWSWNEMATEDNDNYKYTDVYGGSGVNINTKADDADAKYIAQTDAWGVQAFDTVEFTYNVTDDTLLVALKGRPVHQDHYYMKHDWAGAGDWAWKELAQEEGTNIYSIREVYGASGCNWNTVASGNGTWVANPTLSGEPVSGDSAIFAFDADAQSITITKIVPAGQEYVKLTAAPENWEGEYVIAATASDGNALVWTGVDAKKCRDSVAVYNGKIYGDDFTTVKVRAYGEGYSIQVTNGSNAGKYIASAAPANSNGLNFVDAPVSVNFKFNADGTDSLYQTISGGVLTFMYNIGSDQRYRFYKKNDNYLIPCLYKKPGSEPASYFIKNGWNGSSTWSWKKMFSQGDTLYTFTGVYGGTGVNVAADSTAATSSWFDEQTSWGVQALDTVAFTYDPAQDTLGVKLIARPVVVKHYFMKHGWKDGQGASWAWKELAQEGATSVYSIRDQYGATGCNWTDGGSDTAWVDLNDITLENSPVLGDSAIFALDLTDPAAVKITITKIDVPTPPVAPVYVKVTAAPADWSGEYVIATTSNGNALVWNGTDTKSNNFTSVAISNDTLMAANLATVIVAKYGEGYSFMVNSGTYAGKYMYIGSYGAGLKFSDDPVAIGIKLNDDGTDSISQVFASGTMLFAYNSGSSVYKFYKEVSKYPLPCLYRKLESTYTRTVTNGHYGTICLPYASNNFEGMELYNISSIAADGLYLESAGNSMEAGKPYIFLATADEITVTYADNQYVNAGEANGLIGSYSKEVIAVSDNTVSNYILYTVNGEDQMLLVDGLAYVGANRAYIHTTGIAPAALHIFIGNPAPTAVDELSAGDKAVKALINGQVIILRGGHSYNLSGEILK